MIRAVLDTNVFVSAALSPRGNPAKILRAWHAGVFQLVISPTILDEIARVFRYPKIVKYHRWPEEKIRVFLDDLARLAILTSSERTLHVIAEDPSDNRYLESATAGEADYIVSGDEHLLRLEEYQRIRILTPRAFLEILKNEAES
ncbi:MAG TPA: putative toxin-antitoxin system toxin component, PIN family [Methylomirabilota bacterium]|nr:putative toxin-antitoxin system toxin component, PIN family [Methylomirabilota bacterium]